MFLETMPAAAAAASGRTRRRLSLLLLAAAAFAVALFLEVGSNSSRGPVVVGKKGEEVCLWLRNDLNSNIVLWVLLNSRKLNSSYTVQMRKA